MSPNCEIVLVDDKLGERARFRMPYSSRLFVDKGATVARGQSLSEPGDGHHVKKKAMPSRR